MTRRMFATRALYALSFISAAPTAFATFVLGLLRDPDLHLASVFLHRFYTLSGSRLDIHTSQHPCAAADLEEVQNPRSVELKLP